MCVEKSGGYIQRSRGRRLPCHPDRWLDSRTDQQTASVFRWLIHLDCWSCDPVHRTRRSHPAQSRPAFLSTHLHTDIQIDIQTDRQSDRQTDRQTYRHTDSQTDSQTDRHTDRHTDRQTVNLFLLLGHVLSDTDRHRQTVRQTVRQTDRQTDIQTDRHTDSEPVSRPWTCSFVLLSSVWNTPPTRWSYIYAGLLSSCALPCSSPDIHTDTNHSKYSTTHYTLLTAGSNNCQSAISFTSALSYFLLSSFLFTISRHLSSLSYIFIHKYSYVPGAH